MPEHDEEPNGGDAEGRRREGEANAARNRELTARKSTPCIPEGYGGLKTLRVTAVSMGTGVRLEQGEFRNRQGLPGTGTCDDCLWLSSSCVRFQYLRLNWQDWSKKDGFEKLQRALGGSRGGLGDPLGRLGEHSAEPRAPSDALWANSGPPWAASGLPREVLGGVWRPPR